MSFQEIAFTQCKRLPDMLKPFPAAQVQEIQPITKVIFKEITAEPAVNCNVFSLRPGTFSGNGQQPSEIINNGLGGKVSLPNCAATLESYVL